MPAILEGSPRKNPSKFKELFSLAVTKGFLTPVVPKLRTKNGSQFWGIHLGVLCDVYVKKAFSNVDGSNR